MSFSTFLRNTLCTIAFTGLSAQAAMAATMPLQCKAVSPTNRVALIELFTSEGCSSCPPADRWLGAIAQSELGNDKAIPLALHVDYWDYIGWKDPFADKRFTTRQQVHAVRNRLRSIYTPQVVLDGLDYRNWASPRRFLSDVEKINSQTAPLQVIVTGSWEPGVNNTASVSVSVEPVSGQENRDSKQTVHLALFENELSTDVERGENAGRTLKHEAVVRRWLDPKVIRDNRGVLADSNLELPANARPERMGLFGFVQDVQGDVVQAVSCQFLPAS